MNEIRRCSRCILPETFPRITFNGEGCCNECLNHRTVSVLGETKLREILQADKGGTYDCVVPISGGKDSTYVLYYAAKVLNLKVIAVNYDLGFQSDLAKENVKNMCRVLNVPLVVKKADYETQLKMLRAILRMSEIQGTFLGICGNCGTNYRTLAINTAKEYKVPFILYGDSPFEGLGSYWLAIKAFIMKMPRTNAIDMIKLLSLIIRYCFYSVRQRIEMKVPLRHRFQPIIPMSYEYAYKGIRVIHFFNYVEWDSINKASFLEDKLGWKHPGGYETRFDCLIHCFGNHRWLQNFGISADGFNFSAMLRENRMERKDALLKERMLKQRVEKECLEVIEKIGLRDYKMPRI